MRKHIRTLALVVVVSLTSLARSSAAPKPSLIDARSIWSPSAAALAALRTLPQAARTRDALVEIMRKFGATEQAVAFTKLLPGEPAYLRALDDHLFLDGFKVGQIWRPFRQEAQKSFVMLNGKPPIVVVSDADLLKNIRLDPADTRKVLGARPEDLRCDWAQPLSYEIGPGVTRPGTSFEVLYPITSTTSGKVIGSVYVLFNFEYPHWRFLGTSLDAIEKGTPSATPENLRR